MKTLIVGVGALGGIIAARLVAAGAPVSLATRDARSAEALRAAGLRVDGIGGPVAVATPECAAMQDMRGSFDLIVLATKAQDAIDAAPRLVELLTPGGVLLPIQNGGVSKILSERFGAERVLGGLSNLGGTMTAPGVYEQRNAGHLLIGPNERIRDWLGRGVDVKTTPNLEGAVWSKLLVNCSVTTLGAIAGQSMRTYIASAEGRALFERTYDEALAVALASGARPERMIVDPIPGVRDVWLRDVLAGYGDLKPSMLQDFERGRPTEVDFINGYVVDVGARQGVATPLNRAITALVHAITRGERQPHPKHLRALLDAG